MKYLWYTFKQAKAPYNHASVTHTYTHTCTRKHRIRTRVTQVLKHADSHENSEARCARHELAVSKLVRLCFVTTTRKNDKTSAHAHQYLPFLLSPLRLPALRKRSLIGCCSASERNLRQDTDASCACLTCACVCALACIRACKFLYRVLVCLYVHACARECVCVLALTFLCVVRLSVCA
jgi:hypothetical protein